MTILLLDKDDDYNPSAMIETNTLTVDEVQKIIDNMETNYEVCYDSEILTDILIENGCTINWIHGDEVVYW